jgi:hypothetical protein
LLNTYPHQNQQQTPRTHTHAPHTTTNKRISTRKTHHTTSLDRTKPYHTHARNAQTTTTLHSAPASHSSDSVSTPSQTTLSRLALCCLFCRVVSCRVESSLVCVVSS